MTPQNHFHALLHELMVLLWKDSDGKDFFHRSALVTSPSVSTLETIHAPNVQKAPAIGSEPLKGLKLVRAEAANSSHYGAQDYHIVIPAQGPRISGQGNDVERRAKRDINFSGIIQSLYHPARFQTRNGNKQNPNPPW